MPPPTPTHNRTTQACSYPKTCDRRSAQESTEAEANTDSPQYSKDIGTIFLVLYSNTREYQEGTAEKTDPTPTPTDLYLLGRYSRV